MSSFSSAAILLHPQSSVNQLVSFTKQNIQKKSSVYKKLKEYHNNVFVARSKIQV